MIILSDRNIDGRVEGGLILFAIVHKRSGDVAVRNEIRRIE